MWSGGSRRQSATEEEDVERVESGTDDRILRLVERSGWGMHLRYGKAAAGQRIGGDVRLSDTGAGDRPAMA